MVEVCQASRQMLRAEALMYICTVCSQEWVKTVSEGLSYLLGCQQLIRRLERVVTPQKCVAQDTSYSVGKMSRVWLLPPLGFVIKSTGCLEANISYIRYIFCRALPSPRQAKQGLRDTA